MQTLLDKEEMAAKTRKDKQLQLIEAIQDLALDITKRDDIRAEHSECLLHLSQAIQSLASSAKDVGQL